MLNNLKPLILMLLMWQCTDYEFMQPASEVKPGESFTLEPGQQVKIVGEQALVLQLTSVKDSRCPSGAICGWLGNAKVALTASSATVKNLPIHMSIGDCRPEPIRNKHARQVQIGGQSYNITLKEVLPYPGKEKDGENKRVRLVVK